MWARVCFTVVVMATLVTTLKILKIASATIRKVYLCVGAVVCPEEWS